ncbi:MAG: exodeoxyribonuclease VII small subunit [Gammaproteobacteria bacterium]|nr:exodeoxyribonuclease VII small subunit [Gammaproteobacteria bacterium]
MPKKTQTTGNKFHFEKALNELEQLVNKMEQEDLDLDVSLENFEKGMKLIQECQNALQQAELKVKTVTEQ